MKTDEQIKVDIGNHLKWDARIDASDIRVTVDDGTVKLKGHVPSTTARAAASEDAHKVGGVLSVDNNLDVQFPESKTVPSDEDIQFNVKTNFSCDSDLNSYKIDVSVEDGWVTLEGTVDALWEKAMAKNEAMDVHGVIGVTNTLAVVPTEDYRDEDIAEDIVNALERNVHVTASDIDVKVENGEVTLKGTVDTLQERNHAFDAVRHTDGVVSVDNEIRVD